MRAVSLALVALLIGCQPEEQEATQEPVGQSDKLFNYTWGGAPVDIDSTQVIRGFWIEGDTVVLVSLTDTVRVPMLFSWAESDSVMHFYYPSPWVDTVYSGLRWETYDSTVMALPNTWNTGRSSQTRAITSG